MCGIVGAAGDIFKREKDVFENLLVMSQLRGPHSTGVGSVGRNKDEAIVAKCVGRPDNLIDFDKRYDKVVDFGKKFMLGHNRYATQGGITKRNAHPFLFSDILGCHNGTIPQDRLKSLRVDFKQYGTDSEAVLANINEHGVLDTFKDLTGAWAFVWYDTTDNSVNMLRNSQRDLYYVYTEDRKTMFWASESGFIKAAMARNELKREKAVFQIPAGSLLKWTIPEYGKPFELPVQLEIPSGVESWGFNRKDTQGFFPQGGEPESFPRQSDHRHQHQTRGIISPANLPGSNSSGSTTLKTTTEESTKSKDAILPDGKIIHLPAFLNRSPNAAGAVSVLSNHPLTNSPIANPDEDFRHPSELKEFSGQGYFKKKHKGNKDETKVFRGFRGEMLNKSAFENATKEGCVWCDKTAQWGHPIRFIEAKRHICLECNNDQEVVSMALSC